VLLYFGMWKLLLVWPLFLFPSSTFAAGLVPCGGAGEDSCGFCHILQLIDNVFTWLGMALGLVAVLVIIFGGLVLVTSLGNASAKVYAKKTIANYLVGYVIFLAAWMIVDFILSILVDSETQSFWEVIQCSV
jgi:Type IV secretion system pilin